MKLQENTILKALIDRSEAKEKLYSYFLPAEEKQLRTLPTYPFFSFSSLIKAPTALSEIHYSWFVSTLKALPDDQKSFFFMLFNEKEREQLKKLVGYNYEIQKLPSKLSPFLAFFLKKKAALEPPLPKECLPDDEYNILLTFTKKELIHLIDLLGIYDLAADLRQIVDKSILSKIATCLTKEQLNFLQYASKQSLRYLPHRKRLSEFDGDRVKLNKMLHERGLHRLGGGICLAEPAFLWHFLHKLDMGRAAILKKVIQETRGPEMIKFFKRQVLTLSKRMKA